MFCSETDQMNNLVDRLDRLRTIASVWISVSKLKSFTDQELVAFVKDVTHMRRPEADLLFAELYFHRSQRRMVDAEVEKFAKALADGNEIVERLLAWSMRYNGNRLPDSPELRDGVWLWRVGHNSSHEFYAGTADGKRYRYSVGEGLDEELTPVISPVTEVAEFSGYYGHY